jgi:carbamoyltransferase
VKRRNGMAVLGLSALAHDPAAALIVDGHLVAAVEEERINRHKRTHAFPAGAITVVLDEGRLRLDDIDQIGYYWNDRRYLAHALREAARQAPANPVGFAQMAAQRLQGVAAPAMLRAGLRPLLADERAMPPIRFVDHHHAHLLAGWLSAPFAADAAIVVDGRGEVHSTSLYDLRGGPERPPRLIESYPFPNSLGVFYGAVTQLLGYTALSDEYKVMGLASYGRSDARWRERVRTLFRVDSEDRPHLDVSAVRPERCSGSELPWLTPAARGRLAGRFRDGGTFTQEAFDFAHAAQEALEEAVLGLLRRLVTLTGARRVVLTGGVAMNAAAVGKARASGIVDELHVPLAPADSGASIGAALDTLRAARAVLPPATELVDPFLGPGYSDEAIEAALVTSKLPFRRCETPRSAAESVAAGRLVGWFDGRMEFGERALGARSILGDPRQAGTRDRINASVKRRESYRPFAPSVLEEHAARYFATGASRRMGEIVPVTAAARDEVPAVVHVDGTARPQTVPADWPARAFRKLIEHFHALTGVPMVVNTSFNIRDEPIVCTPEDALRCFAVSGLDELFIGAFVVDKAAFRG